MIKLQLTVLILIAVLAKSNGQVSQLFMNIPVEKPSGFQQKLLLEDKEYEIDSIVRPARTFFIAKKIHPETVDTHLDSLLIIITQGWDSSIIENKTYRPELLIVRFFL